MQTYKCDTSFFGQSIVVELDGTVTFLEILEFVIDYKKDTFANKRIETLGIFIPNRRIYVDKSQTLLSVFGDKEQSIKIEIQQNNEPPQQQQQSQSFHNSDNQQFTQYGQPQVQINSQHQQSNQNNQYPNQQPYQQQQQFNQSQKPLNNTIVVIIKMDQNTQQLVTETDSTLGIFYVNILEKIDFDGQYQLFFGNLNLSQLDQNLLISQVGINNNSVIEIKKAQQILNNENQFYEQMNFQEVHPTVNQQQQLNQPPVQQGINDSTIAVQIYIQDGLINREFVLKLQKNDILQNVVDSILSYQGLNHEVAGVELKYLGYLIQGQKLQCTFYELQITQNYTQMTAKIRYIGG